MSAPADTMTLYTAHDAGAVCGLPYHQICRLAERGVLGPSAADADGSGSRRLYTRDDLVWLAVVSRFAETGFGTAALAQLVAELRPAARDDAGWVASSDGCAQAVSEPADLFALLERTESVLVIADLAAARAHVDARPVRGIPLSGCRPAERRALGGPRPFAASGYGASHGHQAGPHH